VPPSPRTVNKVVLCVHALLVISAVINWAVVCLYPELALPARLAGTWQPHWVLVVTGLVALAAAAATPFHPVLGIVAYMPMAYGFTSFQLDFTLVLGSHILPWIVGLSAWGALAWMGRRGYRHRLHIDQVSRLMILLTGWVVITWIIAWSGENWQPASNHHPVFFLMAMVMYWLARCFVRSKAQLLVVAAGVGLTVSARALAWPGIIHLHNDLAAMAVVALPLVAAAIAHLRSVPLGLVLSAQGAHLVWLLYKTQNRAAAVAFVAASIAAYLQAKRKLLVASIVVPAVIVGTVVFSRTAYWQRFADIWQGGYWRGTVDSRVTIWKGGWRMTLANPLFGVGPGNFEAHVQRYEPSISDSPHNNFIGMMGETGLMGAVLYGAFFFSGLVVAWRAGGKSPAAKMLAAAIVAYLAVGMFMTRHTQVLAYVLVGAAVGMARDAQAPDQPVTVTEAPPRGDGPVADEQESDAPEICS